MVASPLQRAQETAAPIAAAHGLEIVTDDRLIEAGNLFEGLHGRRSATARCASPQHWPQLRDPFTPSWGEPYLRDRAPDARPRCTGRAALAAGHEARVRVAPAADLDAAPVPHRPAALARPAAPAVLAGVADQRSCSTATELTAAALHRARRRAATRPSDRRMSTRLSCRAAAARWRCCVLAGCCDRHRTRWPTGGEFQFVAPGGQTEIFYDPPADRGARSAGIAGREPAASPARRSGWTTTPGQVVVLNIWGSWCGPCREEMPDLQLVDQTRRRAWRCSASTCATTAQAAADFLRDRGVTFESIFDPPGRSLLALSGYPRNVGAVHDRAGPQHRVAAVFLPQIRVAELIPLVQRLAAEPPTADSTEPRPRWRRRAARQAGARHYTL